MCVYVRVCLCLYVHNEATYPRSCPQLITRSIFFFSFFPLINTNRRIARIPEHDTHRFCSASVKDHLLTLNPGVWFKTQSPTNPFHPSRRTSRITSHAKVTKQCGSTKKAALIVYYAYNMRESLSISLFRSSLVFSPFRI